ncbi:MAG TPA: NAC family transcription factor [Methanoregulaceae archaeon]|nr:NAC family transcription factor [Methanoregulaceae archaeon]
MAGSDNEGTYCTICGGIPPDKIKIKKILIDGKETGIDKLDWIFEDIAGRNFPDDKTIIDEIIKRVQQFNYIPSKKMTEYREALLQEFRKFHTSKNTGNKNR